MPSKRIDDLDPKVAKLCRTLISRAEQKGHRIIITMTLRSEAEQLALFAQGRKALGAVNELREEAGMLPITLEQNKICTKNLTSYHQYGRAFDFALLKHGENAIEWRTGIDLDNNEIPDYNEIGLIAEELGLVWGGRFGETEKGKGDGWDACHCQYSTVPLRELREGGNYGVSKVSTVNLEV